MHSERRQLGLTLVEVMIVVMLSFVVVLGAGAVYRGVDRSFKMSSQKVVSHQGATQLTTVISRRARVASGFMIYNVPNRTVPSVTGDGIALLDDTGNVQYRFEWDVTNTALADSSGNRVSAANLQNVQFEVDQTSPLTILFGYQSVDDNGHYVEIESAVSLRN